MRLATRLIAVSVGLLLLTSLGAPPTARASTPTTVTLAASPNPAWSDEEVTVTATVTPNPGGGYVNVNSIHSKGDFPVDPVTGAARLTEVFDLAGARQVDATFLGFGDYAPSTKATTTVQVNDHPVALTLHAPSSVGRGDPFQVTIDADESPTPGHGSIQVRDMTLGGLGFFLGSVPTSGESPLTVQLPGMLPGNYKLQAVYTGTLHFMSATSGLVDVSVFDRPTTTTLTATPDPSDWGAPVNVHVEVDPFQAEGNLVIKVDGSIVATSTLNPNGVANVSIVPGAPGEHTITAEFGSQANPSPPERWAPSSDSEPHTVTGTPVDTNPPTGTVSINGGADTATDIPIGLTLSASDDSGIEWTDISSDGVTWYSIQANVTDYGWNPTDPAYGGTDGDGTKTVYVRWRDWYGNTSEIASDFIWLDFFGPQGTVTIFDGSGYLISSGPSVPVSVPATDDGSAVAAVSLSNDATIWTTLAYAPTLDWSLTPGDGLKTVSAKWQDSNGHRSDVSADTITVDTTAPSVSTPTRSFVPGSTVNSGVLATKFAWLGTDATSGIARYEAAVTIDGGAYSTISTQLTTATVTRNLGAGHSYGLRARGIDNAGNVSAWVYGSTFSVKAYQESSTSIVRKGTWSRVTSSSYWGGAERYAKAAGAFAKLTFTGRSFAWIGAIGPTRGSAKVYVNGVYLKTVSLYSASTAYRRVLVSLGWSTATGRTVKIVVVGTAGHPRVDLDAFVTGG